MEFGSSNAALINSVGVDMRVLLNLRSNYNGGANHSVHPEF